MNPSEKETMQEQAAAPETDAPRLSVVKLTKKKKNKKIKYSRGLKDLQQSGRSLTRISARVARASAKGMETYLKASDKSARKKRDGAMLDFGENVARGASKTIRLSSRVPIDIARALTPASTRKRMRRQLKASARVARAFRIR